MWHRRSAAQRRAQRYRPEARRLQVVADLLLGLSEHRGSARTRLGEAVLVALRAALALPVPTNEADAETMDLDADAAQLAGCRARTAGDLAGTLASVPAAGPPPAVVASPAALLVFGIDEPVTEEVSEVMEPEALRPLEGRRGPLTGMRTHRALDGRRGVVIAI